MLGRHHISISIYTVLPFLVPILFLYTEQYLIHSIIILVGVYIGSLLPDADCNSKTTLYYKSKLFSKLVNFLIIIPINLIFGLKNRHRGLFHSPIGILLSSIILATLFDVILWYIDQANLILTLSLFTGIVLGQILHLLEDSCTISGIMWAFPFSKKKLHGNIYTYQRKKKRIDIRPALYKDILIVYTFILALSFRYDLINYSLKEIYKSIAISVSLIWLLILILSKSKSNVWYWKEKTVRKLRRIRRKFF